MSSSSGSQETKSLPLPLVETNAARKMRPVYLKCRPLSGIVNGVLTRHIAGASHWALEVGQYTYALAADETKGIRHFRGKWLGPTTVRRQIGMTEFTDTYIDSWADAVIEDMRSVGEYHMVDNNCQIFYRKLSNVIVMNRNYSNDNINDAKTIKLLAIQALKDFKHSIFGDD